MVLKKDGDTGRTLKKNLTLLPAACAQPEYSTLIQKKKIKSIGKYCFSIHIFLYRILDRYLNDVS